MDKQSIAKIADILRQRFGNRVQTNESVRAAHSHNLTYLPPQLPDIVVYGESTKEVGEIVELAARHKVPIIPFGTGTSLEGGVNAPHGGISLDLSRMQKIIKLHEQDLNIEIEAGVTRKMLNQFLRDKGLFFPIDPGADASLGGMAATRASGTNAVRYGTMRENVINVTAVMSDGRIVKTGGRAKKSAAGYDLTKLFVGSEGTLAIITELTVKLYPLPEKISVGICQFDSIEQPCNATIMAMQMGLQPARIELLDELAMKMVINYSKINLQAKATLFLEFHGGQESVKEQTKIMNEIICEIKNNEGGGNGGGDNMVGGNSKEEIEWLYENEARNNLWKARHDAFYAMLAGRPGCRAIVADTCVPISQLAKSLSNAQQQAKKLNLQAPIVGHVGDGNFHITPLIMMDNKEEVAAAKKLIDELNRQTILDGGTCTGEHGIGQGKRKCLPLEHGHGADIMAAIKLCLDPDNILNPSKVVSLKGEKL